jgi:hypothetical protein
MANLKKILQTLLSGTSDANIRFTKLCTLLIALGFEPRIRGDHHIFTRPDIPEILNLQPKGSNAKIYQVKQIRNIILKYRLSLEETDE